MAMSCGISITRRAGIEKNKQKFPIKTSKVHFRHVETSDDRVEYLRLPCN